MSTAAIAPKNLAPPTCSRWSSCGVRGGGCCALGRYGGRPSYGVCQICPERDGGDPSIDPADRPPRGDGCSKIRRGAVGLVTAAAGALGLVEAPAPEVVNERARACGGCDQATRWRVLPDGTKTISPCSVCLECGCLLAGKIRVKTEACPRGKWEGDRTAI